MSTNQLTCKNCGSNQVAEFCSHCGQKTITDRYTTKSFFIKFLSAFNFEKGFFYTLKMLFINPGEVVNNYLSGKTKAYYNPLNYLLLAAGIGTALMVWFGVMDANIENYNEALGFNKDDKALNLQKKMMVHMKQYINIIALLMLPFISLFSKWLYNKHKLFYGEHLIMNSFLFGQTSVISIIFFPLLLIFPYLTNYYSLIAGTFAFIYFSYALKGVFKNSMIKSMFGTIVIFVGGYILFFIFFMIVMIIIIIVMTISGVNLKELLMQ
jgi:hypothetical protein